MGPESILLKHYWISTPFLKNLQLLKIEKPLQLHFWETFKHSRTVHSLIPLLHFFPKIKLIQVCPPNLEIPEIEISTIENVISITDVLYVSRIQKERFTNKIEYDLVNPITVNKKLL